MSSIQDDIRTFIVDKFGDNQIGENTIEWERVEPYAIDDACRLKKAALGIVDQGQRFDWKVSVMNSTWRLAIEWFVQADPNEDIQELNDRARADVFRTIMDDIYMGGLTFDTNPIMDEVFLQRAENWAEGVMLFDVRYRTNAKDISASL